MDNILSIDLESWVHFYEDALKINKFTSAERKALDAGYIPKVLNNILNLLDKYNQKATFFVVGELYDWYPKIISEIKKRGHEVGYHTHTHLILRNSEILKEELIKSQKFIKKFKPKGFRAPQIFLTEDSMKTLEEFGFTYSSSSYDDYRIEKHNGIYEIPVSAISYFKKEHSTKLPKSLSIKLILKKIPFGSGLFISILGSKISFFINKLNRKKIPAVIFIHPWQIYPVSEITNLNFKLKLFAKNPLCIPYTRNILKSVERLLNQQRFTSFKNYFHGKQTILE